MKKKRAVVGVTVAQVRDVAHFLAIELMTYDEPIPPFESRFPEKLESCLKTPFQKFGGKSLYSGLVGKGSMLFYLMIKNHPFQNGNKRMAVMTLLYFLYINGYWLDVGNNTLYKFATGIAGSDAKEIDREMRKIRGFLKKHMLDRQN